MDIIVKKNKRYVQGSTLKQFAILSQYCDAVFLILKFVSETVSDGIKISNSHWQIEKYSFAVEIFLWQMKAVMCLRFLLKQVHPNILLNLNNINSKYCLNDIHFLCYMFRI